MAVEQFTNNGVSTLNGGVLIGALTLVVASAATFPGVPQFRVRVENELMLVTGVAGTTFTVTRGIEGTAAAGHATGLAITHVITAAGMVNAIPTTTASHTTSVTAADPGHVHANSAGTAVATLIHHETFLKPEAAAVEKATILPSSTGPGTIVDQAGHPRIFQALFDVTWDGGNVTLHGSRGGVTITDLFTAPLGGGLVHGVLVFDTISSVTNSVGTGVGVVATSIQTDLQLGFASTVTALEKANVDGVSDGTAALDAGFGAYTPGTAANGTHNFETWTRSTHNHSIGGSTGSTSATVNITDGGHTHTLVVPV